ncbi:MAG TPA: YegS/Rv2252/BmrU family lipid kinase [Candidatus Saccharimonadales bacterium]|jgi:YegS/Rv2252/BmrU family lipid kinase
MKEINAELIINSGSRRSKSAKKKVIDCLNGNGFRITRITEIKRTDSLVKLLAPIKRRKPRLLIAGGGDGTISAIVDHIVGTNIALGVLPLGTTNNFARSLNIPLDIDGAVRVIRENKPRPVDLGMINSNYFTNVTGLGLSALVARNTTNTAKRRWGRYAYAVVGSAQLFRHKPFMVTIEDKDHELKINFETHQLIIANGRFHAGKQIAVDAKVDNRELIVFALGGRSKLSFILGMLDFYIGKRKNVAHSSYLIARDIVLRTEPTQLVEVDGEMNTDPQIRARVAPKAIKVCYSL